MPRPPDPAKDAAARAAAARAAAAAARASVEADYARPLDADDAYDNRKAAGPGRGTLKDSRVGYVQLRRRGFDDLRALQRRGVLTAQEVLLVVGLLSWAGFWPDRRGVVLGGNADLAEALGVHRNRLRDLLDKIGPLGILDEVVTGDGVRAGWRFTVTAWLWLTEEGDHPAPAGVAAALAAAAPGPAAGPEDDNEFGPYGDPFAVPP